MRENQKGEVWVVVVVVAVIVGLAYFTWWSVSHSKEKTGEVLKQPETSQEEEAR